MYQRTLRGTIAVLLVVAAIPVLVATLWMPVLQIYGSSMSPTLEAGQIVVSVKTNQLKTGEIVAFWQGNKLLVKRVIAGPGQWVDIDMDGNVTVDGQIPDYQLNPEMEMPEITLEDLDGAACIGVLEIPAIDLKLPVLSEWSYPLLKKAPCRYSGSAYLDNLVIAAHNYRTHFGKLKELEMGDEVIFTDAAGNRFEYKVAAVEALTPQSVEDMTSGEWALSLFTCTLDGKNRVTVRCEVSGRTSCER